MDPMANISSKPVNPMQTSFGGGSGCFAGGLKLHQGTQNITSNADAASVSDISKSDVQGGNKF